MKEKNNRIGGWAIVIAILTFASCSHADRLISQQKQIDFLLSQHAKDVADKPNPERR